MLDTQEHYCRAANTLKPDAIAAAVREHPAVAVAATFAVAMVTAQIIRMPNLKRLATASLLPLLRMWTDNAPIKASNGVEP